MFVLYLLFGACVALLLALGADITLADAKKPETWLAFVLIALSWPLVVLFLAA